MAALKTKLNDGNVNRFLSTIPNKEMQHDCQKVLAIMKKLSKKEPKMWGSSIVGFGSYHYKYDSGREGDWFLTGFSPRKQYLTLYIMSGFDRYPELMEKLGKHKTGKSCLYVKTLGDIDLNILEKLIKESLLDMKKRYR